MAKKQEFERLITEFGKNVDVNCPLPEYPRPQMRRDSYVNLNGEWDYAITPMRLDNPVYSGKILVPFSPESILSGVERILQPGEYLYYKRYFSLPEGFNRGRVLLNFGAVDYEATVYLNDKQVGYHRGGYYPFSLDITDFLKDGDNKLVVKVSDPSDTAPGSRGKQKLKRGGIFYTPQSGIWQTVWLESVPDVYVTAMYLTPDIDSDSLEVRVLTNAPYSSGEAVAYAGDKVMAKGSLINGKCTLKFENYELWSPENPALYDLVVVVNEDVIVSYFGMRKFSVGKDDAGVMRLKLNNKPYFHNGLLDQGYWPDGLYTPPSDEAMIFDIAEMKKLGFNMLRKHIKLEPMRWYYHCDRLGMLVWQDMVNGGMGANTVLYGIRGFLHLPPDDSKYKLFGRQDAEGRKEYYTDTERTVLGLYNCVSIALWVPFNESWGQFDALKATDFVRALDPTRPVDHASGWHDQGGGDFCSLHIYFKPVSIPKPDKLGRTVILSEFGGYSVKIEGHVFNKTKSFGYRKFADTVSFDNAYHRLFEHQILPLIPDGLSATVYTQLSDVEDEINGLYTYDRKILKLDPERLKKLNAKLKL